MSTLRWRRTRHRRLMLAVLILLGVVFVAVVSGLYPYVHNRWVHPLGRLAGRIEVGDRYEDVRREFAAYYVAQRRLGNRDVQLADGVTRMALEDGRRVPEGRLLHLYDTSLFDDVQLGVRFDPERRVAEVRFIGD